MTLNIEEKWWLLVRNSKVADGKALRIIPAQDRTKYKASMGQSRRVWLQRLNPYPLSDKWHTNTSLPLLWMSPNLKMSLRISTSLLDTYTHTHTLRHHYRECAITLSSSTITELHVKRASSELTINNLTMCHSTFWETHFISLSLSSRICHTELKSDFNSVMKRGHGRQVFPGARDF